MIGEYDFGQIAVDGKVYNSDLIILPDRVIANWWRQEGHRLAVDDLQDVIAAEVEVLVVGTGKFGAMKVPPETVEALQAHGIQCEIAPTDQACQIFEELRGHKPAAAALHLTC